MAKRKINEIFHSLQGEGHHSGQSAVFVRFSGCNLNCGFCDTLHTEGRMMDDEEILAEVKKYPSRIVVLTGGEPSLWIDHDFVQMLKDNTGREICIETNGTNQVPDNVDWITFSPKFDPSGQPSANLPGLIESLRLKRADEIKVVDVGQNLEVYFSLPQRSDSTLMYLQPCHVANRTRNKANLMRTVAKVKSDPRWTLSVQLHRFLQIP